MIMLSYFMRLAIRSLRRNPILTALMVVAIAVGIGASMTTLTVMHVLSSDPLPGKSSTIFYPQVNPSTGGLAATREMPDMLDYRSAVDLWTARRARRQTLVADSELMASAPASGHPPVMLTMLSTTSDFFPMFDVPFEFGRAWTPADDSSRARVAVISNTLNDELFGGTDSVGKTLQLNGNAVRVVGVLKQWHPAPVFYDVAGGHFMNGDTGAFYSKPEGVFVPFFTGLEVNPGGFQPLGCWQAPTSSDLRNAPCYWVSLWVQLTDSAAVASYRNFLANYAREQQSLGRFKYTGTRMFDLMQWLRYNRVVPGNVKLGTWLAFAFLVICLCNTVGLLLAKFMRNARELGIRRALGAGRREIFGQCLAEAALIGLLGGAAGLVLTLGGLWLMRQRPTPYAGLIHMDVAMFIATFAVSIAASLVAGVLPALRAARIAPMSQLKLS